MVLLERNNFPPKHFVLPASETETFRELGNISAAATVRGRANWAKSVSLGGSCSAWLSSAVPNRTTQLLPLFFVDLRRATDQSMEEKQGKRSQHLQGKVTGGHVSLIFEEQLGQTQNFNKA